MNLQNWRKTKNINYVGRERKSVYVFKLSNDEIKVGISSNIRSRANEIEKTSNSKVIDEYRTKKMIDFDSYEIEQRVHENLKNHCVRPEYFKGVSFELAINSIEQEKASLEANKDYKHLNAIELIAANSDFTYVPPKKAAKARRKPKKKPNEFIRKKKDEVPVETKPVEINGIQVDVQVFNSNQANTVTKPKSLRDRKSAKKSKKRRRKRRKQKRTSI